MIEQLAQSYGILGVMAAMFATVIIVLDKRYNKMLVRIVKEKDAQIAELKSSSIQERDSIAQFLRNQNQLITNQNDLIKTFTEIALSFKALVNVMTDRPNKKSGL